MTNQERLEKKLAKEFYENSWRFRGTEFLCVSGGGFNGISAVVHFICGYGWVKSRIFTEEYGVENSVCMFTGDDAADECIKWTAFKLVELYKTVSQRVAPYESGHNAYMRAVRGEVL